MGRRDIVSLGRERTPDRLQFRLQLAVVRARRTTTSAEGGSGLTWTDIHRPPRMNGPQGNCSACFQRLLRGRRCGRRQPDTGRRQGPAAVRRRHHRPARRWRHAADPDRATAVRARQPVPRRVPQLETATRDYAEHLRDIQAELHRGLLDGYDATRDVLVFAAHLYVEGALPSRRERPLEITVTYATAAATLLQVSYAALGHIHRPQAITRTGVPRPRPAWLPRPRSRPPGRSGSVEERVGRRWSRG